ncbi:MAG TPA: sulfite exporter TauE/SafE family protein [Ureibacillus sp.]|nr:sulfite exporter TauE/SafE family protein [Ureibacillus sp.]
MMMFATFLILGLLLGFAGAGGSGFVFALLITVFALPVPIALGTSLTSMFFTVIAGAISHIRQKPAYLTTALHIGLLGAVGAFLGSKISHFMDPQFITIVSACMLFISSFFIWYRTRLPVRKIEDEKNIYILKVVSIGLINGFLSGCFGIGATPLIQLSLIIFLGLTLAEAASISMIILLPVSFFGALGYIQNGFIDWGILFNVILATVIGSYIGAKFTKTAPTFVLRGIVITLPILGGIILLV